MEHTNKRMQEAYKLTDEVSLATRLWVQGDCMDSPSSPLRMRDGQQIIVHEVEMFRPYRDIEKVRGKVCVIQYSHWGYRYFIVKEIVDVDPLSERLKLRYYNPQRTDLSLNVREIERVWVVDNVI